MKQRSPTEPSTGNDLRREPRLSYQRDIHYATSYAAASWEFRPAQLLDCSAHGIGIECQDRIEVGEELIVTLELDVVRLIIFRVQNIVPHNGNYRVGGQFISIMSGSEDIDLQGIQNELARALFFSN